MNASNFLPRVASTQNIDKSDAVKKSNDADKSITDNHNPSSFMPYTLPSIKLATLDDHQTSHIQVKEEPMSIELENAENGGPSRTLDQLDQMTRESSTQDKSVGHSSSGGWMIKKEVKSQNNSIMKENISEKSDVAVSRKRDRIDPIVDNLQRPFKKERLSGDDEFVLPVTNSRGRSRGRGAQTQVRGFVAKCLKLSALLYVLDLVL